MSFDQTSPHGRRNNYRVAKRASAFLCRTAILGRFFIILFPLYAAHAKSDSPVKIVCEALMDDSINLESDRQLREISKSWSPTSVSDPLRPKLLSWAMTIERQADATKISAQAARLGGRPDAQILIAHPLPNLGAPSVIHYRHKRDQYDIAWTSARASGARLGMLTPFELRRARARSVEIQGTVVTEAMSPNGHSYVAAFRKGEVISTVLDQENPLTRVIQAHAPAPPTSHAPPPGLPAPPTPAPTAQKPPARRPVTKAFARREDWQRLVRQKPVAQIELPFRVTSTLGIRLLDLPFTLPDHPGARVALGFVDRPISLIPFWKDSGHSPFVIYVDGYQYVLTFDTEESRARFLAAFRPLSSILLSEGRMTATPARYTVVLTPAEFRHVTNTFSVNGEIQWHDGFSESTWREVKSMDWVDLKTVHGIRYFFDRSGKVLALRDGSRYFKLEIDDSRLAANAASHAAILRRQRGRAADAASESGHRIDPNAFDLREAAHAVKQLDEAIKILRENAVHDLLIARLDAAARAISPAPVDSDFLLPRISHVLRTRERALDLIVQDNPNSIASDIQLATDDLCRGRGEMYHRFVWIVDVPLAGGGLILGRTGQTVHFQMLTIATGLDLGELLLAEHMVRGGLLRLNYDASGALTDASVAAGRMLIPRARGLPREVNVSSVEAQTFAMAILNMCKESQRSRIIFAPTPNGAPVDGSISR